MRKFTLLAALLFSCGFTFAQNLVFMHEGKVIPNGEEFTTSNYDAGKFAINPEIVVTNQDNENVTASLKVILMGDPIGGFIGYCGFGTELCAPVNVGAPVSRTTTIGAGQSVNPDVELQGPAEDVNAKVILELSVGDKLISTITINFVRGIYATSINSVNANSNLTLIGNELSYRFDNVANRQLNIYNVTGSKVKSEMLETEGTVVIDKLNKGIYIYEVVENGKRIAAHKCVIR